MKLDFEAKHLVEHEREARWAWVFQLLSELVTLLPSYKDTRPGRAFARTLRIALMALGVLWFASADGELRLVGVVIASLVLVLPVADLRRRTWVATLKRRTRATEKRVEPVRLTWDGARLDVTGTDRLKRVLTKPGKFVVESDDEGVVVRSHAGRKAETVVLAREPGVDRFWASEADVEKLVRGLREIQ